MNAKSTTQTEKRVVSSFWSNAKSGTTSTFWSTNQSKKPGGVNSSTSTTTTTIGAKPSAGNIAPETWQKADTSATSKPTTTSATKSVDFLHAGKETQDEDSATPKPTSNSAAATTITKSLHFVPETQQLVVRKVPRPKLVQNTQIILRPPQSETVEESSASSPWSNDVLLPEIDEWKKPRLEPRAIPLKKPKLDSKDEELEKPPDLHEPLQPINNYEIKEEPPPPPPEVDPEMKRKKVQSLFKNLVLLCSDSKQYVLIEKFLKISSPDQCLELLRTFYSFLDSLTINDHSLNAIESLVLRLLSEPLVLIETQRIFYLILVHPQGSKLIMDLLKRKKILSFLISLIKPNLVNLAKTEQGAEILKCVMSAKYDTLQQSMAARVFESVESLIADEVGHTVFVEVFGKAGKAERWPVIEKYLRPKFVGLTENPIGLKVLGQILQSANEMEKRYLAGTVFNAFVATPQKQKILASRLENADFCRILVIFRDIFDSHSKEKLLDALMESIDIFRESSPELVEMIKSCGRKIVEPTLPELYERSSPEKRVEILKNLAKNLEQSLNDDPSWEVMEKVLKMGDSKEKNVLISAAFQEFLSTSWKRKEIGVQLRKDRVCWLIYRVLGAADDIIRKVWVKLLLKHLPVLRSSNFLLHEKVKFYAAMYDPNFAKTHDSDMRLNYKQLTKEFPKYVQDEFALDILEKAFRLGQRNERLALANAAFQTFILEEANREKFETVYLKNPKICRIICQILEDSDPCIRKEWIQVLVKNLGSVRDASLALYDKIGFCDIVS